MNRTEKMLPEQSHQLMDLDLEESGDLEGVTELNNKHSPNNYDVQMHMDRDSVRLSRRSPGKKNGRGCLGTRCLLAIIAVLVLLLLAVAVFLLIYFLSLQHDGWRPVLFGNGNGNGNVNGNGNRNDNGNGNAKDDIEDSVSGEAKVSVSAGTISGKVIRAPGGNTDVEAYLGIPYAKPPTGNLRYADPVPYGAFPSGSFEAKEYGDGCPHYLDVTFGDFMGSDMWNAKTNLSEDCLSLNVWVPRPRRQKRAVMVWIYGGGYYSGSSSLWVYDGTALAAEEDVIVASMNYRLGSFGFLSTGDGRIKGNFGLKDQTLALKWIRDNIEEFGGDPEYVTIFGESAGAASVGYHVIMPQSKGLFRRAIMQSGTPNAPWGVNTPQLMRKYSKKYFEDIRCPDDASVLDCLRQKHVDEILANEWVASDFLTFPWGPSIDNEYITDAPNNLLRDAKYNDADLLFGVNKDEGTYWILYALEGFSKDNSSLQTYSQYLKAIDIIDFNLPEETRQQIKDLYAPADLTDQAALRDALDDVAGDRAFICPVTEWAEMFRQYGRKVFYYILSYRASNEVWPPWMGTIHGADVQWVFGMPLNKSRGYTVEEEKFTKDIMSYWGNFAKYGNPNGRDVPYWPEYSTRDASQIEFKKPSDYIIHRNTTHRKEYCQFWNQVQQKFLQSQYED